MTPADDDLDESGLDFALSLATRIALKAETPQSFLDWLADYGLGYFIEAGMVPDIPKDAWRGAGAIIGRALWNHMPRPENDFKPFKLPDPGRNDPCPCGSGRKYKQCCGGMGLPPLEFSNDLLLVYVLEHLTNKQLDALPWRRFSPELLAEIARKWQDKGETARGRRLLEPMFGEPRHLDERHAAAFDALMDIYLDLNMPKKRKALLEAGLASTNRVLRGTAHQHHALMTIDAGDHAGAWVAFQKAQRDNPDDPNLAALEISLLQGEGKPDQLKERARFWAAKLKRRPDAEDLRDMIVMLEETAAEPDSFADRFMASSLPELAELARLIGAMSPIARPPELAVTEDGRGIIEDHALSDTDHDEFLDLIDAADAKTVHAWLGAHPTAWDSPDILDTLIGMLVEEVDPSPWLDRHILAPLFERARALTDAMLAAQAAPLKRIEWGFLENRALLSLLMHRALWLVQQGQEEAALQAGEEIIAWNPNDNQGVRDFLGTGYARAGRYADLLSLAMRYPDDFAATRYNHALALYALDRRGEALTVLADAAITFPKALKMLLAESPKPVRPDRHGMEVGGNFEAWAYREATIDAWHKSGALEWARACVPALKKSQRK
jgi:tetratricopeptide (TPR) repeat protein